MITLIAAIGRTGELGLENKLLWNIPEDMKHFKSYTMGKVIIVGRRTFQSIGNCLPGRKTIVVSSGNLHGCAIQAGSVADILSIEHCYPELVVIGGASLYNQMITHADKLVITHVDAKFHADTYFPEIDMHTWKINSSVDSSDAQYEYKFVEYTRNESRPVSD